MAYWKPNFRFHWIINTYFYRGRKILLIICFLVFLFVLNLKFKRPHFLWLSHEEAISQVAFHKRESLKKPFFPLPLSFNAGTNLIWLLLLLLLLQSPFDSHKNSFPHSISGKILPRFISETIHAKLPWKTIKKMFFSLLRVVSGCVVRVS